jgi:tetratricopeptide (TPR) repeat protein
MNVVSKSVKLLVGVALLAGLSMPAYAVDSGGGGSGGGNSSRDSSGPTLSDARARIRAEQWDKAVALLKTIVSDTPNDADANNLLGYALRKSGDYKNAEGFYLKALKLNPKHRGAHEYLGELYVEIGQMAKARDLLARLEQICGNTSCEEYRELADFIAAKS